MPQCIAGRCLLCAGPLLFISCDRMYPLPWHIYTRSALSTGAVLRILKSSDECSWYRDIKPENILLKNPEDLTSAVVSDFDMAIADCAPADEKCSLVGTAGCVDSTYD